MSFIINPYRFISAGDLASFEIATYLTPEDFKVQIDGASSLRVDWGDGSAEETINGSSLVTHSYATPDTRTITIVSGTATRIAFGGSGPSKTRLLGVSSVISASLGLTSAQDMFNGCSNLATFAANWFDSASANITNMVSMFRSTSIDPDMSGWDTAKVTTMAAMFLANTSANPDLSGLDTGLVESVAAMFLGSTSADPDVSALDVTSLTSADQMFLNSGFTQTNYDKLLSLTTGWPSQALQDNVPFHAGTATYDDESSDIADGRALLVAATPGGFGWTITDGGPD